MSTQLILPGGIFAAGTPGGFEDIADLLPPGYSLAEIDSLVISCQRAPIGFLQFYDVAGPPFGGVPFCFPITETQQVLNFQELGQPIPPFSGLPPIFTCAWSLTFDGFTSVLDALPSAELDILYVVRANPPS